MSNTFEIPVTIGNRLMISLIGQLAAEIRLKRTTYLSYTVYSTTSSWYTIIGYWLLGIGYVVYSGTIKISKVNSPPVKK
jgi:hypothetical protein